MIPNSTPKVDTESNTGINRKTPWRLANYFDSPRKRRRRLREFSPEQLEARTLLTVLGPEMIVDGSFENLQAAHGVVPLHAVQPSGTGPVELAQTYRSWSSEPGSFDELGEFNSENGTSVGTYLGDGDDEGWLPVSQYDVFNLPSGFSEADAASANFAGFWHMRKLGINTTADVNGDGMVDQFYPNGGSIDVVTKVNEGLGVTQNIAAGGYQAQHGSQSIELTGTPYTGLIAHDLETKVGALYRVEFYVSSNNHHGKPGEDGNENPRQTQVFFSNPSEPTTVAPAVFATGPSGTNVQPGNLPGVFTVDYSGYGWQKITAEFRATTDHTRLAFSAGGGASWLSDPDIPGDRQDRLQVIDTALQTATGTERDSLLALQAALLNDDTIVPLNPEFYGPMLDQVTVRAVNEVPDAVNDTVTTDENSLALFNVFADNGAGPDDLIDDNHGVDENGQPIDLVELVDFTQPTKGILTSNGNGSFSFDPNGEFEYLGHQEAETIMFTYTLRDCFGAEDTATVTIVVEGANDNGSLLTFSAIDIFEDQSTIVVGSFEDTDINDLHTVVIAWGDGTTSPATADQQNRTFTASHQYLDDDPSGTPFDQYSLTATLTDWGNAVDSAATQIRVTNVGPVVSALNSPVINEDGIATIEGSFADVGSLDTHTVDITWGDGTTSAAVVDPADRTFSASHQYLDDNPTATPTDVYDIGVLVTDDDTGIGTAATTVTVNNVPPDVSAFLSTPVIDENGVTVLQGTIVDVGSLDTFSLSINWNDPLSPNDVQHFQLGGADLSVDVDGIQWDPASRQFSVNHQYLDDNPTATASDNYTVTIDVTDDDLGIDSIALTQTVKNVAPVLTLNDPAPLSNKGAAGESIQLDLSFTDPGTLDVHSVTVDWGDGSVSMISVPVGDRALTLDHVYSAGGVYDIDVTLQDDDTALVSASRVAVISGVSIQTVDGEEVLQVIGTANDDHISINQTGNGKIKIHWNYLADNPRTLSSTGIDRIQVILCDGDDHLNVSGRITLPTHIDAGAGDDHINGGGGSNVILGGDGNDHLNGGASRDIIIGGSGADRIVGGPGNDLMTGGILSDATGNQDILSNSDMLIAVQDRWLGDIDGLLSGEASVNDDPDLAAFFAALGDDNGAVDQLTGSSGIDWLVLFDNDRFTDQSSNGRGRRGR